MSPYFKTHLSESHNVMIEYICKTCQLHVGVFAFAQQQQINLLRICVLQSDIVAPNVCNSYRLLWIYNFFIAFLWTIQTEQSIVNQLYAGLSSRDQTCRLHLWFSFSTDSVVAGRLCAPSYELHFQTVPSLRALVCRTRGQKFCSTAADIFIKAHW